MKNAAAIVAVASCLSITAHAESAPQVPEGLVACSKIQDAAERVRCYDAQVAAMKKTGGGAAPAAAASSSAAPASTAAPAPTAPPENAGSAAPAAPPTVPARPASTRESATQRFGEEELPPSRQPKRPLDEMSLTSSITGVMNGTAGVYYFSLANGQVWRADGAELALSSVIPVVFRVGVPIRIDRGALGSYHMWAPAVGAKNWMYVKRIQ